MNFYHSGGILLTRKTSVHQQRAQDGHGGKFFIKSSENLHKTCLCPYHINSDLLEPVGLNLVGCYFFQMALDIAAAFPGNSTNMIIDTRHK